MKKSILNVSLLVGLSTLFVACGSHHHAQAKQKPQTSPQTNNSTQSQQPSQTDTQSDQRNNQPQNPPPPAPDSEQTPPSMLDDSVKTENDSHDTQSMNENTQPNTEQQSEQQAGSNDMGTQQQQDENTNRPKREVPPREDMLSKPVLLNDETLQANWEAGACDSINNCYPNEEKPNSITIKSSENASEATTISLNFGENTDEQKNYKFTLLGENGTGAVYYGHRSDQHQQENEKLSEIVYGKNTDLINKNALPSTYSAKYQKTNGFIYMPFLTDQNMPTPSYADIYLTYKNGKAEGKIIKSNESDPLFNINNASKNVDNTDTLTITPTNNNPDLQSEDKAIFTIYFLNSAKEKNDRKYIAGSGSGNKWTGILVAEKQDTNSTTTPKAP
ncbi:hypothetical protein ACFSAV_01890 [Pasteurella oralis]|uniref:Uncharacterized protein n=1 Tax=Pasteurella oralis TaxID=1071947 RepID=A0ABW4NVP6_9PAST